MTNKDLKDVTDVTLAKFIKQSIQISIVATLMLIILSIFGVCPWQWEYLSSFLIVPITAIICGILKSKYLILEVTENDEEAEEDEEND